MSFNPYETRWLRWRRRLAVRGATLLSQAGRWLRVNASVAETCGILTYHRVAPVSSGFLPPTHNVTPDRFRRQMEGLLRLGYRPWPLRALLECAERGERVPERAFAVTFDDGYENVYHYAWPVLRELEIPAAIFLATAYLDADAPFPFDDWPAAGAQGVPANSWRPLSTEQCRELAASGLIELGAHTHTHADFRGRPRAFADDLQICLGVLREKFGVQRPPFAFPYGTPWLGYCGGELTAAARSSGARCALSTEERRARVLDASGHHANDAFAWGRFATHDDDSPENLAAKLDGSLERVRDAAAAARRWLRLKRPPSQCAPRHAASVAKGARAL